MYRRSLPLLALVAPFVAEAAAPGLVPVTGYLTDTTGAPINDTVTLHLKLYGSTGPAIWSENQDVDVDNGQFTVYLGDTSAIDLSTFRDNGTLFLGVAVDSGNEMTPRFELATAPFAAYAQYCDDAATVGGIDPATFAVAGDPIEWADLQNVPASLNDGDQDTTYTNGTGIDLSGTQFSANQATIEGWARGVAYESVAELRTDLDSIYMLQASCTANQLLLADSSGNFVCTDASALPVSEAAVDAAVANNGYVASSALGTAAYTNSSAYATAAQGTLADGALLRSGGTMTGAVVFPGGPGGWSATGTVGVGAAPSSAMVDIQGRRTVALTGTMGVLNGSVNVVGVGTQFTTQLNIGDTIMLGSAAYTVATITSNTALTLTAPHSGGVANVTGYVDGDLLKVRNGAGAVTFSVDKSGIVREPKRPYFLAGDTNGWQTGVSGWNALTYNRVLGGNAGGWYNPATGLFTAPVAGVYECTSHHYLHEQGTMPNYIHHQFSCNGDWNCGGEGGVDGTYGITPYPTRTNYSSSTATRMLALNKGDAVGVSVYLSGAGTYRYGAYSQFGCALVGAN